MPVHPAVPPCLPGVSSRCPPWLQVVNPVLGQLLGQASPEVACFVRTTCSVVSLGGDALPPWLHRRRVDRASCPACALSALKVGSASAARKAS